MERVVLVTGGSRGIGAATALLAAQRGWAVAVNYASQADAAQQVVRAIEKAGGRAMAVKADVAASGGLPDRVRQLTPQVPMQRAGTAEEVPRPSSGPCRRKRVTPP